jgi:UDP-N-acetylglucosamine 1-carboxyvinyltransferase
MDKLVIQGGAPLSGTVPVSGAKNAALPILIATLLAPGVHEIRNVPDLVDVGSTLSLLGRMGLASLVQPPPEGELGLSVRLDATRVAFNEAPYDLVRKMRASVLALGPLLARCGEAHVSLPGGCAIGVRPIDQHLKGLEALGCEFQLEGGYVHGTVKELRGAEIVLDMPTVTGTENILMAAALARGRSVIRNAAREPEIVALASFLRGMGASIVGEGSEAIEVEGVAGLRPGPSFAIIPDRIEAATYLIAAAITGGDVLARGAQARDMQALLDALAAAGADVASEADGIRVRRSGDLRAVDIETQPFPGFPTDVQAQWMALMCVAKGTSTISETIFENRFMHAAELGRLGASIGTHGHTARVKGKPGGLVGATVMATDLRASASLVLAGLAARGRTDLLRLYHLDRGYERLEEKLTALGAKVERTSEDGRRLEAAG